jgi:NADH-quinone oxidoreductase subunit H
MKALATSLFSLLVFPGFAFLLGCGWLFDWLDRRILARVQGRVGPPWYQPVADFVKLLAKEDVLPAGANDRVAAFLPMFSLASVLAAGLYVPVAGHSVAAFEGDLIVVLFLLSIPALTYFLAGWVSVGVYSILGGNRSLLQYFSYEVPFLMALSGPAIVSGSWSIQEVALRQAATGWNAAVQPIGFLLALVGLIGKLKRDPLDIPKAKSEVVAGSLTEFSGRKLALWHLAMDIQTVVGILLLVNTFLGGFAPVGDLFTGLIFALKALVILALLSTVSALYARLRIDQLASLGWRWLAPLALAQLLVTVWLGR